MKFTFKMESQDGSVIVETDHILTSELCNQFERFLSGCGYVFTQDQEILVWDHSLEPLKEFGE